MKLKRSLLEMRHAILLTGKLRLADISRPALCWESVARSQFHEVTEVRTPLLPESRTLILRQNMCTSFVSGLSQSSNRIL